MIDHPALSDEERTPPKPAWLLRGGDDGRDWIDRLRARLREARG